MQTKLRVPGKLPASDCKCCLLLKEKLGGGAHISADILMVSGTSMTEKCMLQKKELLVID